MYNEVACMIFFLAPRKKIFYTVVIQRTCKEKKFLLWKNFSKKKRKRKIKHKKGGDYHGKEKSC
jgi:hypothetical protein